MCGFNPSGPADDTVLVVRVTRERTSAVAPGHRGELCLPPDDARLAEHADQP